jgi:hypothetical protein
MFELSPDLSAILERARNLAASRDQARQLIRTTGQDLEAQQQEFEAAQARQGELEIQGALDGQPPSGLTTARKATANARDQIANLELRLTGLRTRLATIETEFGQCRQELRDAWQRWRHSVAMEFNEQLAVQCSQLQPIVYQGIALTAALGLVNEFNRLRESQVRSLANPADNLLRDRWPPMPEWANVPAAVEIFGELDPLRREVERLADQMAECVSTQAPVTAPSIDYGPAAA